jgi:hypothetical protein
MINATKRLFVTDNRTGCRFITVDSYVTRKAIRLYTKNHFEFFGREQSEYCENRLAENPDGDVVDHKIETIPMYYDLGRFVPTLEELWY